MKLAVRICFLLISLILIFPAPTAFIYGAPQATAENFPVFDGDRVIRGENARDDSYFEIGKGRAATTGSYLDLYYGHSPTLLAQASTLTLLVDDVPVASVALDNTNKDQTLMRVDLSGLGLKSGYHKLSFQARMELANQICVDPQNPANWMVVYKNSRINLNLVHSYETANLSWYPSPFFEKGSIRPLQSIIAVPDQADQAELVAATRLAQFFSAQAADKKITFPVYPESELTDALLRENRMIWLGRTDRWKDKGKAVLESMQKLPGYPPNQWQGFIGVASSPWNAANAQLMITGNPEELANAASILTDETLYSQLQGGLSLIPATLSKKETPADWKSGSPYTVTFEKLGYSNLTLEGIDQGSVRINYPIPGNWDIRNGADLKLSFKHSKAVDLRQSVITVKLNGVPVESRRLTETTAEAGEMDLVIEPALIGNRRTLEFDIAFQLFAGTSGNEEQNQNAACAPPNRLGNWAVIDKSSSLTYVPVERESLRLDALPYPFVKNGRWDQTVLLLPEQASSKPLSLAMTLAGVIAGNVQDNSGLSVARTSDAGVQELLKERNIIYLGNAQSLPDYLNGFKGSYIGFKGDQIISLTEKAPLLNELQSNAAVIQLTSSPLNGNKALLLIAASTADREPSIGKAFTSAEESGKITGKLAVIDNQDKVHPFLTEEEPLPVLSGKPGNYFNSSIVNTNPFVFPAALLIVVLLIITTLWLSRRRD